MAIVVARPIRVLSGPGSLVAAVGLACHGWRVLAAWPAWTSALGGARICSRCVCSVGLVSFRGALLSSLPRRIAVNGMSRNKSSVPFVSSRRCPSTHGRTLAPGSPFALVSGRPSCGDLQWAVQLRRHYNQCVPASWDHSIIIRPLKSSGNTELDLL